MTLRQEGPAHMDRSDEVVGTRNGNVQWPEVTNPNQSGFSASGHC